MASLEPTTAESVLVIDDDDDFRASCVEVLAAAGYRATGAESGEAALAILRSGAPLPALLILDLMMAGMDGYAFRDAQLADPGLATIPVLVMTAGGDPVRSRLRGAAFLSKLAPFGELLAATRRLLDAGRRSPEI